MRPCWTPNEARGNGRNVAFTPAQADGSSSPSAEAARADREVQAEDDVLVVQRDVEELFDALQTQGQGLALEVQRACRLRLAAARRQIGLKGLPQDACARRGVGQQRPELLVDEGPELGRVAQVVQQVADPRPPGVVPASDR